VDKRKAYEKENKKTTSYSGAVSLRKLHRWQRENDNKQYAMSHHEGNIRYINIDKLREKKDNRQAKFTGKVKIRLVKHPYSAINDRRSSIANKSTNAKYNTKMFIARRVSKDQLANYQKEKPRKLKYSRNETEMWQTGGIAKREADGKITTTKMRPNSRDDQRKELLQKSKAERREAKKKGPKNERTGESQNQPPSGTPPSGDD
jgi:hypothetical protein